MTSQRGFTLVELVVAMMITAIMAAIGYGAINQAIGNRERVKEQEARLVAVQKAMRTIGQDLTQLTPRPVRDPLGATPQPAVLADARNNAVITFTRAGWANFAGVQRASLQRVRYVFDNGTLRREYWSQLDALLAPEPKRRNLLDNVTSVKMRFMNVGHTWQEQWPSTSPPVTGDAPSPTLRELPLAVEVTLELKDYGKIVRLFEVAG